MKTTSKSKTVKAVPEGLYTVTPYLVADNAIELINFMKQAFDARETFMHKTQEGKIMHSTVSIGNSTIMISDTMEGMKPQTGMFYLYLENATHTEDVAPDELERRSKEMQRQREHEPHL